MAEMVVHGDRFDLRRIGRTIEARSTGGALRFALTDELRAFTDPRGGPRRRSFSACLGTRCPRRREPPPCSGPTTHLLPRLLDLGRDLPRRSRPPGGLRRRGQLVPAALTPAPPTTLARASGAGDRGRSRPRTGR